MRLKTLYWECYNGVKDYYKLSALEQLKYYLYYVIVIQAKSSRGKGNNQMIMNNVMRQEIVQLSK